MREEAEQFTVEFVHLIQKHRPPIDLIQILLARLDREGYFKKGNKNKNPELQKVKFTQEQQLGGCESCKKK